MKNKLYQLTNVSVIFIALFCFCTAAKPQSAPIDQLLTLATSYEQVEKTITLLNPPASVIFHIPCISPLYPEDLRRISVSSYYGHRLHPLLHEYKHHSGIDLPGDIGEPVHATADGVIIETGETPTIGKFIRIRHAYGFTTLYGHLSKIEVMRGDTIRIGRMIGKVGSTGRSTGPHLHYGISKNGLEQDPLPYCYLYFQWQKMSKCEGKRCAYEPRTIFSARRKDAGMPKKVFPHTNPESTTRVSDLRKSNRHRDRSREQNTLRKESGTGI